jgi:uncharacterized membrane protein YgaE (UPF0421/DUF939 family)
VTGGARDARTGPSAVRVQVAARTRQGWSRVRSAFVPVLQAAVAGGIAYAIAYSVLGHGAPFFAPVSAWVALGFTADRDLRRVAELAVGVAIGVGLGDLVVHGIGTGAWQVALVLFVAAMVARFLDRGPMLTTQAGVQAIVIVGLPAVSASGGPVGRWTDALVGGLVALAVAALTPRDPRRRPRAQGRAAVEELAGMLRVVARGMRTGSAADVQDALVRGRASQPALDEWQDAAASARDLARVSPAARRHRTELLWIGQSAVRVDRAVRNARVLARRSLATVQAEQPHDLGAVADAVDRAALASDALAAALGAGAEPIRAREELLTLAAGLDPFTVTPDDWQAQSLLLLVRSLVVDLLEASGVDARTARETLPEI